MLSILYFECKLSVATIRQIRWVKGDVGGIEKREHVSSMGKEKLFCKKVASYYSMSLSFCFQKIESFAYGFHTKD